MPGVQRGAGAWDKFDAGTDRETDRDTDSAIVRRRVPPDEATPDEYRWLGDEHEDLGKVASVPARLDRIGWNDDAFRAAAALHGEGDVKFHEGLGRAAEASRSLDPYDATCRSFWVRIDGVDFTKWSSKYGVAKPYDGAVHGAFVSAAAATMRHFRQKNLHVVAAYTQSDEVTFLCAGPAVLAGGASDGTRRLLTLFTSVFSKRFEQALRATKPEAAAEANDAAVERGSGTPSTSRAPPDAAARDACAARPQGPQSDYGGIEVRPGRPRGGRARKEGRQRCTPAAACCLFPLQETRATLLGPLARQAGRCSGAARTPGATPCRLCRAQRASIRR